MEQFESTIFIVIDRFSLTITQNIICIIALRQYFRDRLHLNGQRGHQLSVRAVAHRVIQWQHFEPNRSQGVKHAKRSNSFKENRRIL